MPIYEYRCNNCGMTFEVVSKHGDGDPCCPACMARNNTKLISPVFYRYADHWQQHHMSALKRSQERDEIKKEAQKHVEGAL